jgi:hypothetical protein
VSRQKAIPRDGGVRADEEIRQCRCAGAAASPVGGKRLAGKKRSFKRDRLTLNEGGGKRVLKVFDPREPD